MSIRPPEYDRAPPALRPRSARVRAIVEEGVRERTRALNIVLLAFIFIVVLLPLGFIFYFEATFGSLVGSAPSRLSLLDFPFELDFWMFFLILLTASVGAASVAGDRATRALTLYLARPITRTDYLAAKTGVVGIWVGLGAILPGLIGVVILLALGYLSLPVALEGAGGYLLVGLIGTGAFTGLAILLSSLTARSTVAGAGIFGSLIGVHAVVAVLSGISGQSSYLYLSPIEDVLAMAKGVFGVSGNSLDPWVAGAGMVALAGVTLGLAHELLRGAEVVEE